MLPHEEKMLIDIFKDEELDVFGVFSRRNRAKAKQNTKKKNIHFYKTMVKRLTDTYGKEGFIPYLKALFKEHTNEN